jgi:predicted transposase YbfD/YdcC
MDVFSAYFSEVPDPRASNARHDLLDVMFIALAAVLCGAEDCTDMALFGRAKLGVLREVLELPYGPPSHDTFSRVFRLLQPEPFEAAFTKFTQAMAGALEGVVAIDGKALRGAYERGRKANPLHLINVWAADARLVIGQRLAPDRNEAVGAREALALLRLDGCIVTADALHCVAETARAILDTGADYALAVKGNQRSLLKQARAATDHLGPEDAAVGGSERAHDRQERRSAWVVAAPNLDFPGAAAFARIEASRQEAHKDSSLAVRYFVLSRLLTPEEILHVARTHWTIENQLHWVLDVRLAEDAHRSRKDHAPQNLALVRKLALNTLRQHPDKGSIKGKIKRAGWDDTFLASLFAHMR